MERADCSKLSLSGDLSMIGVTEQSLHFKQYIAVHIEPVSESNDLHPCLEIDLTDVHTLDACGCQLLVAFIHSLKKRGNYVFSLKMTDYCRDIVHTLGFDNELNSGVRA